MYAVMEVFRTSDGDEYYEVYSIYKHRHAALRAQKELNRLPVRLFAVRKLKQDLKPKLKLLWKVVLRPESGEIYTQQSRLFLEVPHKFKFDIKSLVPEHGKLFICLSDYTRIESGWCKSPEKAVAQAQHRRKLALKEMRAAGYCLRYLQHDQGRDREWYVVSQLYKHKDPPLVKELQYGS